MARIVIASNRVPRPSERGPRAGGLAVGLMDALKDGGLWFGWSGEIGKTSHSDVKRVKADGVTYATIDLNQKDYDRFYVGYANSTLWPLLHFRLGLIDFKRDKEGIPARVERIEYDPNRTGHIALLCYADGERRYIIAPKGLQAGDQLIAGKDAPIKAGNALPLRNMPLGSTVHCIEMKPGKGAQLARAAGAGAQLVTREGGYATLRLRSGEMRKVPVDCYATIGEVGNVEHSLEKLGKAGAKRWRGIKPTVRGAAMNPVDHPHGGGEARAGQGNPHPVSPWGTPAKGYKTRHNKRTQKFIVRDRRG